VSLIKVVSSERIRGRVRLRALMGRRAIADYGRKTGLVQELARLLTCGEPEVLARVSELLERDRAGARELRRLRAAVAAADAAEAAAGGTEVGGLLFVSRVTEGAGLVALKAFTDAVLAAPGRFSAAADRTADGFQWTLGHSAGKQLDLASLAAPVLAAFGARGGGKGNRMQGAAPGPERAQAFLEAVREALSRRG
jgi:alanyl-tRNA synthetase